MRPHTLVTPKPLLPIAGKPIVQRLVEDIAKVCNEKITEVAFIIHRSFGVEVENSLKDIAHQMGAEGSIHYQDQPLGTAHAILSAAPALEGKIVVAFADTLFVANFDLDDTEEGIIWTKKVEDPSAFGVVVTNDNGVVTEFVEKPEEFVSDQAIIGIYYFKDGAYLKNELQFLIDNDIRIKGGEFGLTDALENMKAKGTVFRLDTVDEWLDCGNKNATVNSNSAVLRNSSLKENIDSSAVIENTKIHPPVFIGANVKILNSEIGPFVSVESGTTIAESSIKNAIVREGSSIENVFLDNSMIGTHVKIHLEKRNNKGDWSLGDYSSIND